jgi:hypothetical protein
MTNLKFYIVSYNKLYDRITKNLSEEHKSLLRSYFVNKSFEKEVSLELDSVNEWELSWNDNSFQKKQFFEYSCIVHLTKNPDLIKGLSHIGLLHYDIIFGENSIDKILNEIKKNPNKIFYQSLRKINDLYLNMEEYVEICNFMSEKLKMGIDPIHVINKGWISESMSVVPVDVFTKFGNYLFENQKEIEEILTLNRWGIMNQTNHRICGIVERMWGIYLVNTGLELEEMEIQHDWDYYNHHHLHQKNWINQ